nr:hypothetical protein 14 [Balneolaceae bacterium]
MRLFAEMKLLESRIDRAISRNRMVIDRTTAQKRKLDEKIKKARADSGDCKDPGQQQ